MRRRSAAAYLPRPDLRVRAAAFACLVSLFSGLLSLPSAPASAATASILTEYRNPSTGRTTTRSTPWGYGVPVFIDVDGRADTGDQLLSRGSDIRVILRPNCVCLSLLLEVARLDSGRNLPLKLTVVHPYSETGVFSFGFDTRSTTSPANMSLSFSSGGLVAPSLDGSLSQSGAGANLTIFGEVYDEAADGSHNNPKSASIALSPVPAGLNLSLGGSILTAGTGHIGFTSTSPTHMTVDAASLDGIYTDRYRLDVDQLPTSLTIDATSDGTDDVLTYTASASVERMELSYTKRIPSRVTEQFRGTLTGMPTQVTVRSSRTAGSVHVTTSAPIGAITFGTAKSTDPDKPGTIAYLGHDDYAYAFSNGGHSSFAFQIHGLSEVKVGNVPTAFNAILDAGRVPFHAVFSEANGHHVTVDLDLLPDRMEISSDLRTQLSYTATDPVGQLDVLAYDPAGLSDRYSYLRTRLRQIPTSLQVNFTGAGGAVSIDSGTQSIGSLELVLSQYGWYEIFPWDLFVTGDANAGQAHPVDGILLWDKPGLPAMMSARMSGLSRATASLQPGSTTVSLRTNGLARLMAEVWGASDYYFADLRGLAPSVDVSLAPYGAGTRLTYNASRPENRLWFSSGAHNGSSWTWATLQSPLPSVLDVRFNVDNQNKVYFDANEHTHLDMASSSDASVTGGWLRHLRVGSDGGGSSGWVEIDTDWTDMHGDYRSGSTRLDVRRNMRAQDRHVEWWNYIPTGSSGSADCDDVHATVGGTTLPIDWFC